MKIHLLTFWVLALSSVAYNQSLGQGSGIDLERSLDGAMKYSLQEFEVRKSAQEMKPLLEAALRFAAKLQNQPVEWLSTDEAQKMIQDATPEGWPVFSGEPEKKGVEFSIETLRDVSVAFAMSKDPENAAKIWLDLPLSSRESICRAFDTNPDRFRSLMYFIPEDRELMKRMVERRFEPGLDSDSFYSDRKSGMMRMLVKSMHRQGETFIKIVVEKLREDPMDFSRLMVLLDCMRHFPKERYLVSNELNKYVILATEALEFMDELDDYQDEFKTDWPVTIEAIKNLRVLKD